MNSQQMDSWALAGRLLGAGLALLGLACSGAAEAGHGSLEEVVPVTPVARETSTPSSDFDHGHRLFEELLRANVAAGGLFRYGAVAKDPTQLEAYISQIQGVTLAQVEGWTEKQRFAFWINAYNAWTIKKVVDNYPLKSIRKLDRLFGALTVFEQAWIPMNAFDPDGDGDELSLNDIEHEILRARFKDARVHAAINCASFSCPPLRNEAFVAERLDAQLDEQMREFLLDTERNRFDLEDGVLHLSEIFSWFESDFEHDAGSLREYLVRFGPEERADFFRKAKIKYLDYDWDLNEVK